MVKFLGLDQSLTESGWYFDEDNYGTLKTKTKGTKRLINIRERLKKLLKKFKIEVVVMENYSYGSRYNREILGELGGVIKTLAYDLGIETVPIPTSVLKKFITGKGRCKKEVILLYVFKNYGFETRNHNIADAFSLHRIYKEYLEWKEGKKFKKLKENCFKKVKKAEEENK